MIQSGRSRVRFPMTSLDFSIDLIFPGALWPCDRSFSDKSEYHKSSRGLQGGWHVRLTTSQPCVRADCLENAGASTSHNHVGLHGLLQKSFTFPYLGRSHGHAKPYEHTTMRTKCAGLPHELREVQGEGRVSLRNCKGEKTDVREGWVAGRWLGSGLQQCSLAGLFKNKLLLSH
jgi:hypothetical protein